MNKSLDGRAWLFVNQILDLSKRLATLSPGLTAVSVDDMVFLAKLFLKCQADFQANGWPYTYHLPTTTLETIVWTASGRTVS